MADEVMGKVSLKLGLDASSFGNDMASAKRQVTYFKSEVRTLDQVMKTSGASIASTKAKLDSLKSAVSAQTTVVNKLKASFKDAIPGTARFEQLAVKTQNETTKLEALKNQLNTTETAFKNLGGGGNLSQVSTKLKQMSENANTLGEKLTNAGNSVKPMSAALSVGFALSTKKAVDFEGQMTTIRSLLADSAPNAKVLTQQIDSLGESSKKWAVQYGVSTESVNNGISELIKKGYTYNQVTGAMPSILDAARASGEDFDTVMSASSSILEQFGLKANSTSATLANTQRVTDSLTFVANKTAAGFSDMGKAMEYVGPVAHSAGISLEETSSAIGLLSNNGIEGEKAGTALRGALSRLMKPSKQNAEAFAELGFSSEQFKSGAIDLPGILDSVNSSTKGLTKAEKAALIGKAFGVEAQSGMNILVNQGGDALRNLTKETGNATGYTKELAKQMNTSGKAGVDRFKESLEVLQINVGQKLLPALTPILDVTTKLIDSFSKLNPGMQQFIEYSALALAGSYPILSFAGLASKSLGGVASVLAKIASISVGAKAVETATGFEKIATSAGTATGVLGKSGGLVATVAGATSSLPLLGVAAGAAAVGLTAWGVSALISAQKARQLKQEHDQTTKSMYGFTSATKAERAEFDNTEVSADNVRLALGNIGKEKISTANIDNAKKAFDEFSSSVEGKYQTLSDKIKKALENKNLPASVRKSLEEQQKAYQDHADKVEKIQTKFNETLDAISKNGGTATKQQAQQLNDLNKQMVTESIQSMRSLTTKQKNETIKALNGDYGDLNLAGMRRAMKNMGTAMKSDVSSTVSGVKEAIKSGGISASKAWGDLANDSAFKTKLAPLVNDFNASLSKINWSAADGGAKQYTQSYNTMKQALVNFGIPAKQVGSMLNKMGIESATNVSAMAKYGNTWNTMSPSQQVVAGFNKAQTAVLNATSGLDSWNKLTPAQKSIIVNDKATQKFLQAIQNNGKWNRLNTAQKNIIAKDLASGNVSKAKKQIDSWVGKKAPAKNLTALNKTASGVQGAQKNINSLKGISRDLKANNKAGSGKNSAQSTIDSLKGTSRNLTAVNRAGSGKSSAQGTINSLQGKSVGLHAEDRTWPGIRSARSQLNSVPDHKTSVIDVITNFFTRKHAKGTNYHQGGLAMVNDQAGPTYKELVTLPSGQSFIPNGRNVVLPLPVGSQVLKASKTKQLIPKYAQGIGGIPANSDLIRSMNNVQQTSTVTVATQPDNSMLNTILRTLQDIANKTTDIYLDGALVGKAQNNFDIKNIMAQIADQQLIKDRSWN